MKMTRKLYTNIFVVLACLVLGLLTGCGSSSSKPAPTIAIAASGGTPQTGIAVGAAFATLQTTVTSNGAPASGVSVTFTAPSSGATCAFTGGATETDSTNSSGVATSSACTANHTAGAFTVTASTSGVSSHASFSLTSVAGAAATLNASSGGGQSENINTAFASPMVANVVDQFGNPVSGVPVTFKAPSSGASCTPSSTTAVNTDSNGKASITCTANANAGAYDIVASSGSLAAVNFSETNIVVTSANYVFNVSGLEKSPLNYYAAAGALTIDSLGNVLAGEEDYNDGAGTVSPNEPNPDTITPASKALVVDPTTGIGTLTITSSNKKVGNAGQQTFAVQFVNANHALITEFDGAATSSGSLDLQTTTSVGAGATFAFAMSGIDNTSKSNPYVSWDFGGVFTTGNPTTGFVDVNDGGTVSLANALSLTTNSTDATFGRTVVTGMTVPAITTLISYPVGPEAMRLIDVDAGDTAVGSAFGQGSATFHNASLTSGVFAMIGQWTSVYATVGQFTTNGSGVITAGIADDNELDNGVGQAGGSIANSTYDLVTSGINGYGSFTFASGTNKDVSLLGLYMVDPAVNINDPNNTSADLGGALIVDLDSGLPGGMGVITPQTDTTAANFNGNYAAGFQNINQFNLNCSDCEFDMVGPFTMSAGDLTTAAIGADDSDPLGTLTGTAGESKGDSYSSAPAPVSAGYYQMVSPNNPLKETINGSSGPFDADIYQASATMLYWIEIDKLGVFLGSIEQQGPLTGMPAAKKPGSRTQPEKQATKSVKTFGTVR